MTQLLRMIELKRKTRNKNFCIFQK